VPTEQVEGTSRRTGEDSTYWAAQGTSKRTGEDSTYWAAQGISRCKGEDSAYWAAGSTSRRTGEDSTYKAAEGTSRDTGAITKGRSISYNFNNDILFNRNNFDKWQELQKVLASQLTSECGKQVL
jgi:hypothetical protein